MGDRWTEADVLVKLATRYSDEKGWALLTGVRSATGVTGAVRTADAIAMQTWPSRGLELHGFEIKVTRSDLARELAQPEKAEVIARYCAAWHLVVPKKLADGLDLGEVPPAWGVLTVDGRGVRTAREPTRREPRPVDPKFLASLLRSASRAGGFAAELEAARAQAREEGRREGIEQAQRRNGHAHLQRDLEQTRKRIDEFETALGFKLDAADPRDWRCHDPAEAARALQAALGKARAIENLEGRLHRVVAQAKALATAAEEHADA